MFIVSWVFDKLAKLGLTEDEVKALVGNLV